VKSPLTITEMRTLAGSFQKLIFKRNAFGVVFLEPGFRGVDTQES